MIISKTPLRIPFFSGSSDLPAFYEKEMGAAISATINKYVYVSVHKHDDPFIIYNDVFYRKEADLTVPGPANTWLLIDENPQSINDAWFVADPTYLSIKQPSWIDGPADYHNGACGISFCDGHAGLKKWRDPTLLALTSTEDTSAWIGTRSRYLPDIFWLVNRSTALKSTTSFLGPQGW